MVTPLGPEERVPRQKKEVLPSRYVSIEIPDGDKMFVQFFSFSILLYMIAWIFGLV